MEAARDNNKRLSIRTDSRRGTDCPSTPYYLPLQPRKWGRSPTPYGTSGTSKCINHFVAILTCSWPLVSTKKTLGRRVEPERENSCMALAQRRRQVAEKTQLVYTSQVNSAYAHADWPARR